MVFTIGKNQKKIALKRFFLSTTYRKFNKDFWNLFSIFHLLRGACTAHHLAMFCDHKLNFSDPTLIIKQLGNFFTSNAKLDEGTGQ